MINALDTTAKKWISLRSSDCSITAEDAVCATLPEGVGLSALVHLRTAHYAVYRVYGTKGESWVARVGVVSPEDDGAADNTEYLGTSRVSPSGQTREHLIALEFSAVNADVCVPKHYARTPDGFDVLWLPFIDSVGTPLSAGQWHHALTSLHAYRPDTEFPVFTNRVKTFARTEELPHDVGAELRRTYDAQLRKLFAVASQWSVVHGDAHAGNAINIGDKAILFDFDTSCWAPSVWDLTHLLNRAGTDGNTGYTAQELRSLFTFNDAEVDAALALRRTAALVAKAHRSLTN